MKLLSIKRINNTQAVVTYETGLFKKKKVEKNVCFYVYWIFESDGRFVPDSIEYPLKVIVPFLSDGQIHIIK